MHEKKAVESADLTCWKLAGDFWLADLKNDTRIVGDEEKLS